MVGGASRTIPLTSSISEEDGEEEVRDQSARIRSPSCVEEIQDAIRGEHLVNIHIHVHVADPGHTHMHM